MNKSKDVSGWRGPVKISKMSGDGIITLPWQGIYMDIPIRNVRHHVPLTGFLDVKDLEDVYQIEPVDQEPLLNDNSVTQLMTLAEHISPGSMMTHAELIPGKFTSDAERDDQHTYNLGLRASVRLDLHCYRGVRLFRGVENLSPVPGVDTQTLIYWPQQRNDDYQRRLMHGHWPVSMRKIVGPHRCFTNFCGLLVYDGHRSERTTDTMEAMMRGSYETLQQTTLRQAPYRRETTRATGHETQMSNPEGPRVELEETGEPMPDPGIDSPRNVPLPDDQIAELELLPPVPDDAFTVIGVVQTLLLTKLPAGDDLIFESVRDDIVGWADLLPQDLYGAVVKENRELTREEEAQFHAEVWLAKLKEIGNYVSTKAGHISDSTEFVQKSGRKPLPWRWVLCWKLTAEGWIIKARLVLKGFAENSAGFETFSPTAERSTHRQIALSAVEHGWELVSMDVGAAFLKGFTFDELRKRGIDRPPCAMVPNDELWTLLGTCNPELTVAAMGVENPIYEFDRTTYGLKDAVLAWHLCANDCITVDMGWAPQTHDPLHYTKYTTNDDAEDDDHDDEMTGDMSLHVDDVLATGEPEVIDEVHKTLEAAFGTIKRHSLNFRHFGMDIIQQVRDDGAFGDVSFSQEKFMEGLRPVELSQITRGSGRTQDTPLIGGEITDFRSLSCGISWVGITSPWAQAAASLYQSFLPTPTISQARMLNAFLEQLLETYVPLTFFREFFLALAAAKAKPRLIVFTDSSFANRPGNYPQACQLLFLSLDLGDELRGIWLQLVDFNSRKSQRVAKSSYAAETLSAIQGVERGTRFQEIWYEKHHRLVNSRELLSVSHSQLVPMDIVLDAYDLYISLVKHAIGSQTDVGMAVYISSLRQDIRSGRLRLSFWIPTNAMLADTGTKLLDDGCVVLGELPRVISSGWFSLSDLYKVNGREYKPP